MTGTEYQIAAMRTNDGESWARLDHVAGISSFDVGQVLNGALGLTGEAGEAADMIKKWIFHGHDLNLEHFEKELGDVLWYVALLCDAFGLNIDVVMQKNDLKLRARYPEAFSEELLKNRKAGDV